MPLGLRPADAPIFQRLCAGEVRLLLRLGQLLAKRLTVTELALQVLVAEGRIGLLLDPELADQTMESFPALVRAHQAGDVVLTTAPDGWRVVCLADEVDNVLIAPVPEPAIDTGLAAVVAGLAPALRGPVEGLLAARADNERAAALEQLRYAAPPLSVVGELMPLLLADGADVVRERAIGLLSAAGAAVGVVDAVRALATNDDATLHRLADSLGRLPAAQQDVVITALVASAARGHASTGLVAVAQRLAPFLAGHRALDRLLELLVPRPWSLLDLVRSLQAENRQRTDMALARHLGMDAEQDARLIVLLAHPDRLGDPGIDWSRLMERGIELLLSPDEVPRERMALATALRRLDAHGAGHLADLLAERVDAIGAAFDTSAWWLLAELCRDGRLTLAQGELLADGVRRTLSGGRGPHLVAVLEQQLPALLPCSPATRIGLVEPVVATVARFHDDRSRDVVMTCVLGLGHGAMGPLWPLLDDHPRPEVRRLCAELLPQICPPEEAATAVRRLLAGLVTVEQGSERAVRVTAAARLAVSAGEPALVEEVHHATAGLGDAAFTALGVLAGARGTDPARRQSVINRLLQAITDDLPDADGGTEIDAVSQEVTHVIADALARHTEIIPAALAALEALAGAPDLDPAHRQRITQVLQRQWRKVNAWQVVWGPGNIRALGESLARFAAQPSTPPALRAQLAESLLPGVQQLPIARALLPVFAGGGGSYLAGVAGRACARLVQLGSEGYWADDERGDLLEVLIEFIALPDLGPGTPALRRRLVGLAGGMQTAAPVRLRRRIEAVAAGLPADLQGALRWR